MWPLEVAGGWAKLATADYALWGLCMRKSLQESWVLILMNGLRLGPGQPVCLSVTQLRSSLGFKSRTVAFKGCLHETQA